MREKWFVFWTVDGELGFSVVGTKEDAEQVVQRLRRLDRPDNIRIIESASLARELFLMNDDSESEEQGG
jgi:hypothetical protein